MTAFCQADSIIVDRVRIRSRLGDGLAAQQKMASLLRNAELRPSSLPYSAILIVRTLRGQQPSAWLDSKSIYLPPEWQESARRELDRLVAQAVRPALAPVPPSAEAVLFADRAELLTCLARDWLGGTLRTNWWWRTLLTHDDADLALYREWTNSPHFVPAALEAMAARSYAIEFLRRIPGGMASSLLEKMLDVFAVPRATRVGIHSDQVSSPLGEPSLGPLALPWLPFVREASTTELAVEKRILLVQALMLRRAPARARSISFQQELTRWQGSADGVRRPRAEEDFCPAIDSRDQASDTARSMEDEPVHEVLESAHLSTLVEANSGLAVQPRESPTLEIGLSPKELVNRLELTAEEKLEEAPSLRPLASVETDFGGVFFLLNVALQLKLYADFTSPRAANLGLDIWDFLCLLGLRFVPPECHDDDIFALLTRLACRTIGHEPGEHFNPPEDWQFPGEWLDAFPEAFEWLGEIRDGRLEVMHPAGFLLLSEEREAAAEPVKPLDRWLSGIAQYIEARLARAFGRDDAARFLCQIPARVSLTSSHVDITYPLNVYPVEIRKAGLDRDPGWIPAAGRFVAFHFV